jgi:ATP-dependent exoDNAse (exonuclease V) beta subunit
LYEVFDEKDIVWDGEDEKEYCPKCGKNGYLMDLGDARNAVLEILYQQFESYKERMLKNSKEDVFGSAYEICFFSEIHQFFNETELDDESYETLLTDGEELLANMYRKYLKWDGYSVNTYSDIEEFVADYVLHLKKI